MRRRWAVWVASASVLGLLGCSTGDGESYGRTVTIDSDLGEMGVIVLRVDRGSPGDFDQMPDRGKFAGRTTYYVRYRLTGSGPPPDVETRFAVCSGSTQFSELSRMGNDPLKPMFGLHGSDGCTGVDPAELRDFTQPRSVDGCRLFASPVGFDGAPTKVVWQAGAEVRALWH